MMQVMPWARSKHAYMGSFDPISNKQKFEALHRSVHRESQRHADAGEQEEGLGPVSVRVNRVN